MKSPDRRPRRETNGLFTYYVKIPVAAAPARADSLFTYYVKIAGLLPRGKANSIFTYYVKIAGWCMQAGRHGFSRIT